MNKLISYIFNSKIFRIILFSIGFILITNYSFSNIVKDGRDQKMIENINYLKENKEQPIDIMFFSNSYLFTAYDPMYIEYLTGMTSIHFGTSARRFCFEPYIIDDILKIKKPKLVVVDISNGILKVPKKEKYLFHNRKGISSLNLSINKVKAIFKYLPKEDRFKTITRTTNILWQLTTTAPFKLEDNNKGGAYGFLPMTGVFLKPKDYEKTFDSLYLKSTGSKISREHTIDQKSNQELKKLIEYFGSQKEIKLLLVSSIKINSKLENQVFLDSLKKEIKVYENIKLLELNSKRVKKDLELKIGDFSSADHLKLRGAYKVTKYFVSYINKEFLFKLNNKKKVSHLFKFKNENSILVRSFKILLDNHFRSELRIVINKDNFLKFKDITMKVNIIPKRGYEEYISKKTKSKKNVANNMQLPLYKFEIVENDMIGRIVNTSKLKKDQIDYIEFWFWNSKRKISTNKVRIKM